MTGTALTTYEDRWAEEAQQAAAAEPNQGGTWLTARGGQLMIGEQQMPGNQVAVIVLDSVRENTYYRGKFDADNPLPPTCYALGRDADTLFPHLDMQKDMNYFQPQHWRDVNGTPTVHGCDGCPMNEWGSADQGNGKACQNRRRLTVIPAGYFEPKRGSRDFDLHLFEDPEMFAKADPAFFKLPVTSVTLWAKYVQQLSANVRRPPHGVVTRLFLEPHAKHQYEARFEMIDVVPDSIAEVIFRRRDVVMEQPLAGYLPPDPDRMNAAQGGGAIRGLRGGQQ